MPDPIDLTAAPDGRRNFESDGPPPTNRVVVRTSIVHCPENLPVRCWGDPYSVPLRSREQAYERTLDIDDDWQELDFGWVARPGLLWIKNLSRDAGIEVTLGANGLIVLGPNRDACFEPRCSIRVRAAADRKARFRLVAVPG
jgi:hypothetical protein